MSFLSNFVKSALSTTKKLTEGFFSGLTKNVVGSATDYVENLVSVPLNVFSVEKTENSLAEYESKISSYETLLSSYSNSIEELKNTVSEYEKHDFENQMNATIVKGLKKGLPVILVLVGVGTFLILKKVY